MTRSPLETTNSSSPNEQDSSSRGLLSRLWQWINSYGGLSDLSRETEALRQQNARLAELESKLDIVLQSSDSNLIPTVSTDDNQRIFQLFWKNIKIRFEFRALVFCRSKLGYVQKCDRLEDEGNFNLVSFEIAFTEIYDKVEFAIAEQKQWLSELQIFFVGIIADIFCFLKVRFSGFFQDQRLFLIVQFYFFKL